MAEMLANGLNMFTFKEVLGKYHHLVTCYNNSNQDKCVEMSDILTEKMFHILGDMLLTYD